MIKQLVVNRMNTSIFRSDTRPPASYIWRFLICAACPATVALSLLCGPAYSQSESTDPEIKKLEAEFKAIQDEFRQCVVDVQTTGIRYLNMPTLSAAEEYNEEFKEQMENGNQVLTRWIPVGEKLFDSLCEANIRPNDNLLSFMSKVTEKHYREYNFERACAIAEKMLDFNKDDARSGFFFVRSALPINRFGVKVARCLQQFEEFFTKENAISDVEKANLINLGYLYEQFQKEKEIREKEAAADDLPRVLIKTNRGDLVIELFENEAPEAVANFISLVESKHFDGLIFDTVIEKTVAQTGKIDESFAIRETGYTIKDEFDKPNARKIFAGSVVMVSTSKDSADSLFFIALSSLVNFHGKQTVFGRVESGLESAFRLTHTFKIEEEKQVPLVDAEPDKLLSATVIRKRDHEYVPNKIEK